MIYGGVAIGAICVLILLVGALKQRAQVFFFFLARACSGLAIIYFCNYFFKTRQIPIAAGMNPVSFLTSGVLGIGGVALIYGILFYKTL